MSKLDLSNVIRVSIAAAGRGLGTVNTSALAIITDEAPIPGDFVTSRTYLNPDGVADDFGSNSETYRLAVEVFSQSKNVLQGGGYLVVIPRELAADAQPATIIGSASVNLNSLEATDYTLNAVVDSAVAADLLIGEIDTTSLITAAASLNSTAVAAAGLLFVVSGQDVASAYITLKTVATGVASDITIGLAGSGTDIAPLINLTGSAVGGDAGTEKVKDAILRTKSAVPYFGIVLNEKQSDTLLEELAGTVQAMDKLLFVGSNLSADITGIFTTISGAGYTHTRCLYYSESEDDAIDFAAGYASILFSLNFTGDNTALTMHLKDYTGLDADTGLTQTLLDAAASAGVDVIADFGIAKIFTSGANVFTDQIYTQLALKVDLQIVGFNYLAQASSKIPQTEQGMTGLKGAYRSVLAQYVRAGVYAPGTWTGSSTFGSSPEDHRRNVLETGFFIYSTPISSQSTADRTARIAPLVQIAAKEAGAIHSSDVSVLIEA